MDKFMEAAIAEAQASFNEGGMPIGSVLVKSGKIVGRGRNRFEQDNSVILHAEMDAIEDAGIPSGSDYSDTVLYTTLSPCPMCSGAVIFFGIPRVVIADNETVMGAEEYLKSKGVQLEYQTSEVTKGLLGKYHSQR